MWVGLAGNSAAYIAAKAALFSYQCLTRMFLIWIGLQLIYTYSGTETEATTQLYF